MTEKEFPKNCIIYGDRIVSAEEIFPDKELELYDRNTREWYTVKRGWFGDLKLVKVPYKGVTKFPQGGEPAYANFRGFHRMPERPLPRSMIPK